MKLFLEILKIIGISAAVGFIVLFFTKGNHHSCTAIDAFSGESPLALFYDFLQTILIAFGIWIIGFIFYFDLRKKKQINFLLFFSILTVLSLHSFITSAFTRQPEGNRKLKQEVCSKSTDNGMLLNIRELNKSEYDFINAKVKWLPAVPVESELINIEYYRDDFLGDFGLKIELRLRPKEMLDSTKYSKWTFDGTTYHYEEYQN